MSQEESAQPPNVEAADETRNKFESAYSCWREIEAVHALDHHSLVNMDEFSTHV